MSSLSTPTDPIATTQIDAEVARLEACFENILNQRMEGVPIINQALSVKALGFQPWNNFLFGSLVTPWFINLVLLPLKDAQQPLAPVGTKVDLAFPAGHFTFMSSYEEELGAYLSCSLLSPVLEITDQALAESVALEALHSTLNGVEEDDEAAQDTNEKTPDQSHQQLLDQQNDDTEILEMPARRKLFGFLSGGTVR